MEKIKEVFKGDSKGGLGRHPFHDPRDGTHLFRHALAAEPFLALPMDKIWVPGIPLDQGSEGACVGFGWTNWENCSPMGQRVQQGNDYAFGWYYRAKEVDPWPGTDYEGTTVRAGARVAMERLALTQYLWAGSRAEIDAWLLAKGPIVVGSDWLESMDYVDDKGYITFNPSSRIRGGHCYLLYGKGKQGNYWFYNSWGEGYGKEGSFRMTGYEFDKLVSMGNAEFCTAMQVAPVA